MMAENQINAEWRIIGETVPGATHLRAGIPNQDALLCVRESSRELPIVISLSDGHGSPKCFRSDRGSRFAVKKAAFLLSEFLDEHRGKFDSAEIETQRDFLAAQFLRRWREAVEADLKKEPFTEKEFETLATKSDVRARKLVEENPLLAYGATSLTAAIERDFVVYLQLGDGDILNISADGAVIKPLPEDARLLANETTSLCLLDAEKDVRFFVQTITAENAPAMILLSTDGYLNSFASEAGFFQAGTDILKMLGEENGFTTVSENLKAWLEEATNLGSGDDCTVAIIYRPDALGRTLTPKKSEKLEPAIAEIVADRSKGAETTETILPSGTEIPDDVTVTITIKKDKNKTSTVVKDSATENSAEKSTEKPKIDAQNVPIQK